MTADRESVFLGKSGQTFGPFTPEEFEAMRTDGRIGEYQYLWDSSREEWTALHAPPPPLTLKSSKRRGGSVRSSRSAAESGALLAVCHNQRVIVSGTVTNVTQIGCDIVSEAGSLTGPAFAANAALILNLLDSSSGESVNVRAQLIRTRRRREDNRWIMQLKWDAPPAIL